MFVVGALPNVQEVNIPDTKPVKGARRQLDPGDTVATDVLVPMDASSRTPNGTVPPKAGTRFAKRMFAF